MHNGKYRCHMAYIIYIWQQGRLKTNTATTELADHSATSYQPNPLEPKWFSQISVINTVNYIITRNLNKKQ